MDDKLDFGDYMHIKNALKTKIPTDARDKEDYRLALYDMCVSKGLDVKETDIITHLRNKLKTLL